MDKELPVVLELNAFELGQLKAVLNDEQWWRLGSRLRYKLNHAVWQVYKDSGFSEKQLGPEPVYENQNAEPTSEESN